MSAQYFGSILEQRLSRRRFLASTGVVTTIASLPTLSLPAFANTPVQRAVATAIEPTRADELTLAAGLRGDLLIRAGDALFDEAAPIDGKTMQSLDLLDQDAGKRQEKLFGTNNDALAFFPLNATGTTGVLCVNHEYVMADLSFSEWPKAGPNRAEARQAWIKSRPQAVGWMQAAHGVSVVQLEKAAQCWRTISSGPLTRRITANTPMEIRGPARGHELMRTNADPSGTVALGTFGNCAGGKTPWGTYLTAEENIQDYFGSAKAWADNTADQTTVEAHRRWPLRERSAYGWDLVDSRFDVRQEPREPLRHGWIVEIDPQNPTSPPKKRTALGRFCHEGANTILTRDARVAAYMGDDAKFEYVYKFVSRNRYNAKDRDANLELLDDGTLYVARFDASGRGEWLPLVYD